MTAIEWTEATWNPLAGCTEISTGCANCYAAAMAHRLEAMGQKKYKGTTKKLPNGKVVWTGKMNLDEDALAIPLSWKKPRRVFVNSMSDLFHENVPDEFIDKVFAVMALCPQHTFQVLTKRAERMRDYVARLSKSITPLETIAREMGYTFKFNHLDRDIPLLPWPIRSVWLGVSVEDQQRAAERIPLLLQTPAAVRFLSCEPLLSSIEFSDVTKRSDAVLQLGKRAIDGIHWVIVGGESGPGARPCEVIWIRAIVAQCKAAGVACFVKQLGSDPVGRAGLIREGRGVRLDKWSNDPDGPMQYAIKLKDKKGGDPSEWPEDLRVREFPKPVCKVLE